MSARDETNTVMRRFEHRGIEILWDDVNTLRRAELTLSRWGERECGDGSDWAIERDEHSGIPYMVFHGNGPRHRYRCPDRERGALRRVEEICKRNGLHYFHQTDPRGCALYVDREPLPDNNYTRGIACSA